VVIQSSACPMGVISFLEYYGGGGFMHVFSRLTNLTCRRDQVMVTDRKCSSLDLSRFLCLLYVNQFSLIVEICRHYVASAWPSYVHNRHD
jgi:hypothetical protein